MSEAHKKNLFEVIRDYWQIVAFIGACVFMWASNQTTLANVQSRVTQVEQKASAIDAISGDVKAINAKLDIIIKKVDL